MCVVGVLENGTFGLCWLFEGGLGYGGGGVGWESDGFYACGGGGVSEWKKWVL